MEPIQAGFAADVRNALKQISDKLASFLDSLTKQHTDWKVKTAKDKKDGSTRLIIETGTGEDVTATISPVGPDSGKFDVLVEASNSRKKAYKNVAEDDFEKVFTEAIDELLGATMEGYKKAGASVSESKHVKVRLRRIKGSQCQAVRLEQITANYDIATAYTDVVNMVQDDGLVSAIPEAGCDYCVEVCDDFFSIREAPTGTDLLDMYTPAPAACLAAMLCCHYWELNAIGEDCTTIRNLVSSFKYSYEWMYSSMARMCVEFAKSCPHPRELLLKPEAAIHTDMSVCSATGLTKNQILTGLQVTAEHVIRVLEAVYVNYPRDAQQQIDNSIRELKSKLALDIIREQSAPAVPYGYH